MHYGRFWLLHQYVAHGFDMLISVIGRKRSLVAAGVAVIMSPSGSKANPRVAAVTVVLVIPNYSDSCFRSTGVLSDRIETFGVAVGLQRTLPYQTLPLVSTQGGIALFAIGNQWVKRAGALFKEDGVQLSIDLHSKTDLIEGRVPICRQFGLPLVEPRCPLRQAVFYFVTPEERIVMERFLCKTHRKAYSDFSSHEQV